MSRQQTGRLAKAKMVSAIQETMQGFGIPSIEFTDEAGAVHGRIDVPKPKDVPCDVPAYGGGTVSIRQGDRIRLWYRDEYTGKWKQENVGVVLFIGPEHMGQSWQLAFDREGKGASSCNVSCQSAGWARVVEKL